MTTSKASGAYDHALEYIDSPLMTRRLVHGRFLSARIDGSYGAYRTTARVGRSRDASCTCPSDYWPCKHVRALRATWDANPESFFDLAGYLRTLGSKPKAQVLAVVRDLILAQPEGLGVLGVQQFIDVADDPDNDDR